MRGTGPFVFVEHVKGSHWVGKKNPNYWDKGKPYLDGYRALFIKSSSAQVAAVRGERAHIQFRGFTPADRDTLKGALGDKITVQESAWDCVLLVAMNHKKKPFDDKRVRRALTLAIDRWEGSRVLSRIAIVKEVAGLMVPGSPWATPPAELQKLAGYGRDIAAARAEARRLVEEAGGGGVGGEERGVAVEVGPPPVPVARVLPADPVRALHVLDEREGPGAHDVLLVPVDVPREDVRPVDPVPG